MDIFSFLENIQLIQAMLLTVGLILLLAEIFIPGFGIAGVTGIVVFIVGILLTARTLFEALIMFLILLFILSIVLIFVVRSATRGRLSKKLVLHDEMTKDKGFVGVEDMNIFLGKTGKAISVLRPSGIGDFDGVRLDVVANGSFIPKNSTIKIVDVKGRRIVVEEINS